jgi:hypothetical protein
VTRSLRVPAVLLLLMTACARRERPFVPGAGPPDPGATRLVVKADGTFQAVKGSKSCLLDAPRRLRLRELSSLFDFSRDSGILEIDALVDTEGGLGAVPLHVEARGRFGYYEKLQLRDLWESWDVRIPAALARPGLEGNWELLKTGTVSSLGLLGEPLHPEPEPAPGPLESAEFILLCPGPEDEYQDVVLSLVALERRFPRKVVLRLPR